MYPVKTTNLKVTSFFGNREYIYQGKLVKDFHNGIDLVGGSEIIAFADGVVTAINNVGKQYEKACFVRLKHSNGLYTLYYHLKNGTICVNVGDNVKQGDKLGIMGATGVATGVHLHFQIDKGSSKTAINPYDYIFNDKEFIKDEETEKKLLNINEIAKLVIKGEYGNYPERKTRLEDEGYNYNEVQNKVNEMMRFNKAMENNGYILNLVRCTIRGDYGNGETRREKLGYFYEEVQRQVNLNYKNKTTSWNSIKLY